MSGFETRKIVANGIHFHVVTTGDKSKPAILMLHGFPERWLSWRRVMELLSEDFYVVAPDLRGYGESDKPADGYDIFTLTDDVKSLIEQMELQTPLLVGHDWGGALAWVFAHRFSALISRLVVVNCTHPITLLEGIMEGEDLQRFRSLYMVFFQIPGLPEHMLTAASGALLRRGFRFAEGKAGSMDKSVVQEIVHGFARAKDLTGPLNYYRAAARMQFTKKGRQALTGLTKQPITVPTTLIWGQEDEFLSEKIALKSERQAGCAVRFRPLPGVGHFVSLEAPETLATEIKTAAA